MKSITIPGEKQGNARTYLQELSEINRNIDFSSSFKESGSPFSNIKQKSLLFFQMTI